MIEKFLITPSEHNGSFPSTRSLPKHFSIIGVIIRLQYEYTPKYNPTEGIDPNAATPNPEYKFSIPPGLLVIILLASNIEIDESDWTCCCTVFNVSNGASIVLEHAAANPDASVFLRPCVIAVDDFDVCFDVVVAVDVAALPPRGIARTDDLCGCTDTSFLFINNFADVPSICIDMSNIESRSIVFILLYVPNCYDMLKVKVSLVDSDDLMIAHPY